MARSVSTVYLCDLALLATVVYYCDTLVFLVERHLHYKVTLLPTAASLTSLYHLAFHQLQLGRLFDSHYWRVFFLAFAYLATSEHAHWNSWTGWILALMGLSFLFIYGLVVWWFIHLRPWKQIAQGYEHPTTPLSVDIAFLLIINGIAIVGIGFVPKESVTWSMIGSAVMLCVSFLLFCCFVRCSKEIRRVPCS
ncbi:hypothetical protein NL676_022466 [Syzygium grande]|nr:hypothetical protein NL676_022466 [Syzygium grande]